MPIKPTYEYDVFISYAKQDKSWVENELLPRLQAKGLKPFIDFIDFKPGKSELGEIERGIRSSRKTLLMISPYYLKDNLSESEKHLTRYMGLKAKETRCIPVIITPCRLPDDIRYLVCIYLTSKNKQEQQNEWDRLLGSLIENPSSQSTTKSARTKTKLRSLPKMEKELRMNKEHWITAGFSMPADQFNFTAVYFENQMEVFTKMREQINSLADQVSREPTIPRQAPFLRNAYEIIDQLLSSTNQVLDILEADKNHELLLITKKATSRLIENTTRARQTLMKSSVSGAIKPKEFYSTGTKLPIELHAVGISIAEVERHLSEVYKQASTANQTKSKGLRTTSNKAN
jgi:hypothetical protein